MANFWTPVSYGYSVAYVLRVAGIPVLFAERIFPTMSLPAGWTQVDASLVVDDSAEVGCSAIDRETGMGTGLDLSFKLLDTSTVRQWMRSPSNWTTLKQNLNATDNSLGVTDATGWPYSGTLYIGQEAMTYTRSGNVFTVTRAQLGTLAAAYRTGFTAQLVTDLPRSWRGRDVELWAVMCDPSGHAGIEDSGSPEVLLEGPSSRMLWRGRVNSSPVRSLDGFGFTAQSLDRYLTMPVAGKVGGKITSTDKHVRVYPNIFIIYRITGYDSAGMSGVLFDYTLKIQPFDGMTPNSFISVDQALQLIADAWNAEVTAVGAASDLSDLETYIGNDNRAHGQFHLTSTLPVYWLWIRLVSSSGDFFEFPPGTVTNWTGSTTSNNALGPIDFWKKSSDGASESVTVELDDGTVDDLPQSGVVVLKGGDLTASYKYTTFSYSGQSVWLKGLTPMPGQKALTPEQLKDGTMHLASVVTGSWADIVLRMLESSGTGLRGDWDTLPMGQGYGIPSSLIDEQGIVSKLNAATVQIGQATCDVGGKSIPDTVGGIMGLFRLALVLRNVDGPTLKLTVVNTGIGSDYTAELTDDYLLTHVGDPVSSIAKADPPNVVTVEIQPPNDTQEPTKFVFTDRCSVDAEGKREVTFSIPGSDPAQMLQIATTAVASHFAADQTGQAAELQVHPSFAGDVGDVVLFTSSHPSIWTWSTNPGQPGYDGSGRITGRTVAPKTGVAKLTVLFDGAIQTHSLAPAMRVLAANTPVHPSWVEVDKKYLVHLQTTLAGGGTRLQHYQPGRDESGTTMTFSAVELVGDNARLTLDTNTVTMNLTDAYSSTLTLPARGSASTYQRRFAYTADGTYWS